MLKIPGSPPEARRAAFGSLPAKTSSSPHLPPWGWAVFNSCKYSIRAGFLASTPGNFPLLESPDSGDMGSQKGGETSPK